MFGSEDRVKKRCISLINILNNLLHQLMLEAILIGVSFHLYDGSVYRSSYRHRVLESFISTRKMLLREGKQHDLTVLMSGRNLRKTPLECGTIGAMCSANSLAVVEHPSKEVLDINVAISFAHEIGHLLGAFHDDTRCQVGIMKSIEAQMALWSNCSMVYVANNIDRFLCLLNPLAAGREVPSCGNGRVDEGEQCDCGPPEICHNTCCNPKTCKFWPHAICASGVCCNIKTCSLYSVGKVCRRAVSECDLSEYCLGTSENCPADVFKQEGVTCYNKKGMCFGGVCRSTDLLCKKFLTPAAKSLAMETLDPTIRFNPCREIACLSHLQLHNRESLYVANRKDFLPLSPAYPSMGKFRMSNLDGFPCSENKICMRGRCQTFSLREEKNCSSHYCHNGVCNSAGNCHCDLSYAPPACFSSGHGGSIDSGHSKNPLVLYMTCSVDSWDYAKFGYLLMLCLVLPSVILILCLWMQIRCKYEKHCEEECARGCPCCYYCLDRCCCPCMSFLNVWLCYLGVKYEPKDSAKEKFNKSPRKTICEIGLAVEPPKAEVKSWGVASDALTTDVITITPKGSPSITKKIRLPSSSLPLRSQSTDDLDSESQSRPKLQKSSSKDSGGDFEAGIPQQGRYSFKTSMGSLISIFNRFGRQTSNPEGTTTSSNHSIQEITKEHDLRRQVVDPMSNLKSSRKPPFARSISTDHQSKPISNSSLHASEQNLHFMSLPKRAEMRTQDQLMQGLNKKKSRYDDPPSSTPFQAASHQPLLPSVPPTKPQNIRKI